MQLQGFPEVQDSDVSIDRLQISFGQAELLGGFDLSLCAPNARSYAAKVWILQRRPVNAAGIVRSWTLPSSTGPQHAAVANKRNKRLFLSDAIYNRHRPVRAAFRSESVLTRCDRLWNVGFPETGIPLKLARKTLRQLDSMWDAIPQEIYRPRNPQATDLHRLVEDNFNQLERVWYERQFRD
jgi:hypothetical protein